MTREEAEKFLPIIQAFAEGKDIEYYNTYCKKWKLATDPTFNMACDYRIKPKSEYRPFNSKEECWNEMNKHKSFIWVKNKSTGEMTTIITLYKDNDYFDVCIGNNKYLFDEALERFTFIDGTPFGIEEEVVKFHNYGDKHA